MSPVKIMQVMPVTVTEDRARFDCHSAGQAALWAFTRSLRRTFGHRIQVMEVILAKQQGIHCIAGTAAEEVGNVNCKHDHLQSDTISYRINLTAQVLAQRIHELEKQGREIVVLPLRYKLSMYFAAIRPWRLG
jgi:hypothetical protein